jgi:hypothetical protein
MCAPAKAFVFRKIATALPAFELRLAGTLNSVTGELMCTYGDRAPIKALANAQDQFVFAIHRIVIEC